MQLNDHVEIFFEPKASLNLGITFQGDQINFVEMILAFLPSWSDTMNHQAITQCKVFFPHHLLVRIESFVIFTTYSHVFPR